MRDIKLNLNFQEAEYIIDLLNDDLLNLDIVTDDDVRHSVFLINLVDNIETAIEVS